jgi:hypothetical protein
MATLTTQYPSSMTGRKDMACITKYAPYTAIDVLALYSKPGYQRKKRKGLPFMLGTVGTNRQNRKGG